MEQKNLHYSYFTCKAPKEALLLSEYCQETGVTDEVSRGLAVNSSSPFLFFQLIGLRRRRKYQTSISRLNLVCLYMVQNSAASLVLSNFTMVKRGIGNF